MTVPFPEDRSFIDENGNIREHWHQFLKGVADGQTDDLSTTVSEQAETITSLNEQLELLRETMGGVWIIDKWVEVQSTSGTVNSHDLAHNLNSSSIIAVLEENQSVGFKQWEYALDLNTWRYTWSAAVAEALVKARFYRIKQITF